MTENSGASYLQHAVVVGVDGSGSSWAAIRAAAWEAYERGQDLVLAHGYDDRTPYLYSGWSPYVPSVEDASAGPRAMLAAEAAKVRELCPDLAVHIQLIPGSGSGALVQLSAVASMVVVGSRGNGGFGGLSIGSTAAQTAAYAACPVLVIRPDDRDAPGSLDADDAAVGDVPKPGPILVGVAGSADDEAALRFAFEEASLRRVPVIGAHVWWFGDDVDIAAADVGSHDDEAEAAQAARVVAEALAGWSTKYPDIAVEQRTIRAMNTSYALIEASAAAGLVVLGCRGRGGFAGLVLGSVSRDLVGHSQAPVAIIHDHA